jgi:hypothetical protein
MAKVLTTGSSIVCNHSGQVKPLTSSAKLTISGNPVLLANQVSSWTIVGCTQTPPPPSKSPCVTVSQLTGASAQKLTANAQPVLLDSGQGVTDGKPPGTLTITAGEMKVTAS